LLSIDWVCQFFELRWSQYFIRLSCLQKTRYHLVNFSLVPVPSVMTMVSTPAYLTILRQSWFIIPSNWSVYQLIVNNWIKDNLLDVSHLGRYMQLLLDYLVIHWSWSLKLISWSCFFPFLSKSILIPKGFMIGCRGFQWIHIIALHKSHLIHFLYLFQPIRQLVCQLSPSLVISRIQILRSSIPTCITYRIKYFRSHPFSLSRLCALLAVFISFVILVRTYGSESFTDRASISCLRVLGNSMDSIQYDKVSLRGLKIQ
jgi:hypothetical protein